MSRIDDLIAQHCPDGVVTRTLGEIGEFVRGNGLQKKDFVESGMGCIHYGQVFTHYGLSATKTKSFVDPGFGQRLKRAKPGALIIATTSENDQDVCKAVAWLGEEDIAISGDAYAFSHSLDPKYVAYYFQSDQFQAQKKRHINGTKVRRVSGDALKSILIPVPHLEVQQEIVKILDHFTLFRLELQAELKARLRQYEHYAHMLLENRGEVPSVRLGDVATIVRGASPRPIQAFITDTDDGVPWIKIGDVPAGGKYITSTAQRVTPAGASKSRRILPGDFVLSNSMSFGRPYISKIDGYIHDGWLAISNFEDSFVSDYLYYLLRSSPVQIEFARRAGSGTVKNLNADIVKGVTVPLPPREKQVEVVELLNRFDALVNDPEAGLPAELAARQKQYEYYRDRLLTFEGASA